PVDQKDAAKADRQIAALDRVMAQSHTSSPMQTWRGVRLEDIGIPSGDAAGHTWTDKGFASTSTRRGVAEHSFSGSGSALLEIHSPEGTPALQIDGLGETEVLLGRGQTYRVVADHGLTPGGARHLEVEVVPAKAEQAKSGAPSAPAAKATPLAEDVAAKLKAGQITPAEAAKLLTEQHTVNQPRQSGPDVKFAPSHVPAGQGAFGGDKTPKVAKTPADPATILSSLPSDLTPAQKRARLRSRGVPKEQIDALVPLAPRAKKAARSLALLGVTRALGHDVTPGHDELHHYWTRDPRGLAKWVDHPKPWTALEHH